MRINCFVGFSILFWSLTSCVSRLERHALSGVIVDINKQPIENCAVGETKTDSIGHFFLPELRYRKFLLTESLIHEAPPVMYTETILKKGYKSKTIRFFHQYGGGIKKGASRKLDTIYIVKKNPLVSETKLLLKGTWKARNSANNDSIFMVRENFEKHCKTVACERFHHIPFNISNYNHPAPSEGKFYSLTFMNDHFNTIIPEDSSKIKGSWKAENSRTLQFKSISEKLNNNYYLQEYDYSYLLLVKKN